MDLNEVLDDLDERIDRAVMTLSEMREAPFDAEDNIRLFGRIQSMLTVKDWIRGYRNG